MLVILLLQHQDKLKRTRSPCPCLMLLFTCLVLNASLTTTGLTEKNTPHYSDELCVCVSVCMCVHVCVLFLDSGSLCKELWKDVSPGNWKIQVPQ